MTYQIEFHDLVSDDYDEAYVKYSLIQEELGERFAAAVRKRTKQISENPEHYGEKPTRGTGK